MGPYFGPKLSQKETLYVDINNACEVLHSLHL